MEQVLWLKELEHMLCEEILREVGLFSLEKKLRGEESLLIRTRMLPRRQSQVLHSDAWWGGQGRVDGT